MAQATDVSPPAAPAVLPPLDRARPALRVARPRTYLRLSLDGIERELLDRAFEPNRALGPCRAGRRPRRQRSDRRRRIPPACRRPIPPPWLPRSPPEHSSFGMTSRRRLLVDGASNTSAHRLPPIPPPFPPNPSPTRPQANPRTSFAAASVAESARAPA